MTLLSTVFMVPALMPDWMATIAAFNPLTWAVDASRMALDGSADWSTVLVRLAVLGGFLVVSVALALRAFASYRRAI